MRNLSSDLPRAARIVAGSIAMLLSVTPARSDTLYWDLNGSTANTAVPMSGQWNGTNAFWNDASTGTGGTARTATSRSDDLIFSSGSVYTGGTITLSGARAASSITFEDNVAATLSGGTSLALGGAGAKSGVFVLAGKTTGTSVFTPMLLDSATSTVTFSNAGSGTLTLGTSFATIITGSSAGLQTLEVTSSGLGGVTIAGAILNGSGGGTVALNVNNTGSGVTTLSGTNTYTGGTTVSAGKLVLGSSFVLPSTGAVNVNGGTLDIGGFNSSNNAGVVTLVSGSITGTSGSLTAASYAVQSGTITARLGGSGGLTKSTAGTVTLSGANSYFGETNITAGTLACGASNAIGSGAVTVNGATAVLDLGAFSNSVGTVTLDGGAQIIGSGTLTSSATFELRSGSVSAALNTGVSLFGLNKTTAGTVTLSGANSYFGPTTVSEGTLALGKDNTLPDFGAVTVNGGTLDIGAKNDTVSSVTLTSGSIIGTTGTLTSNSGYFLQSGSVSAILGGARTLTKTTAGTVTLAAANTYSGSTLVSAGTLALTNDLAVQNSVFDTSGAGSLDVTGVNNPTFGGISDGVAGQNFVLPGNVASLTLNLQSGSVLSYSKSLGGGTGLALTKSGAGIQVLSGASSYTGTTMVAAGALILAGASAYPGPTVINSGGAMTVKNGNALSGAGNSVTVATGGAFNYAATTDAPLTLGGTLAITGGVGTTVGGTVGSTATSTTINVSAASATGPVSVNLFGITGVTPGLHTLLHAGAGSSVDGAVYSLGTVHNNVDWTVSGLMASTTELQASINSATPLAAAYWKGGFGTGAWAASNGSTVSNWAASAAGGAQGLIPGSSADVVISATSPVAAPNPTTLGADMAIRSLTNADTATGLVLNADGNTLTIGTGGISVSPGVPTTSIAANLVLGANQTWSNHSYAALTVNGAVGGSGNLVKAGVGTMALGGSNSFTGNITVASGVLSVSRDGNLGDPANGVIVGAGAGLRTSSGFTLGASRVITVNGTAANPSGLNVAGTLVVGGSQLSGSETASLTLFTSGSSTNLLSVEGANAGFAGNITVGAPGQLMGQFFMQRNSSTFVSGSLRLQDNGTLTRASSLTVNNGWGLTITQPAAAVTSRLSTSTPLTFHSGQFQYNPSANSGAAISDTFGPLNVTGQLSIAGSSTAGPAAGTILNFGNLTRSDHATMLFRAPQSGTQGTFGGPAAATSIGIFFANLTPDTTTSGTTRSIVPWAGNAISVSSTEARNFMTYDANGFRPLNTTTEVVDLGSNGLSTVATGVNVRVSGSHTIKVGGQTINSYSGISGSVTGTATAAAPGDVLTITSGGIATLFGGTFDNATVNFPNGGYFHVGFPVTISANSRLTGTGGIVASSLQNFVPELRFTNTPTGGNSFTGGLYANGNAAITFTLNNQLGNDDLGNAAGDIVLAGGQLIFDPAAATTVSLNDGTNKRAIKVNASNGTIGTGVSGAVLQIPGTISGAGQVQFGEGAESHAGGVVELTNASANTYAGGTLISTGILRISNPNQLGSGPILLNGGTLQAAANLSFASAPTLVASSTIDTQANEITLSAGLNGSGGTSGTGATSLALTKNGAGTLTVAASSDYAGRITLSGTLQITAAGNLGSGYFPGAITNNGVLRYSSIADQTFAGALSGATGTLVKDTASSLLTLAGSGSNSFGGLTTVSAGTLVLDKNGSATAIAEGGLVVNSDGTVRYAGNSTNLMGNGAVTINGSGILDFNGKTDSIGNVTILANGNAADSTPMMNTGGGGNLTIGTLGITPAGGLNSVINSGAGGTLTLGGTATFTPASTGRAQIIGAMLALGGDRIFDVGLGSGSLYDLEVGSSIIGSSNSLTKLGAGRLLLSGANTYSGATTINAGTLLIAGSIAGSAATVNNTGSIVGGIGIVGDVSVGTGASLRGGDGTAASGSLRSGGAISLGDGAIIQLTLGAGGAHSSLVRTSGLWSFDNDQAFAFTLLGAEAVTYDNVISGLGGSEAGLSSVGTWLITNSSVTGTFSYDNAGGVDLVVTSIIPEPAAGPLLLSVLPLLISRRRLQKQSLLVRKIL